VGTSLEDPASTTRCWVQQIEIVLIPHFATGSEQPWAKETTWQFVLQSNPSVGFRRWSASLPKCIKEIFLSPSMGINHPFHSIINANTIGAADIHFPSRTTGRTRRPAIPKVTMYGSSRRGQPQAAGERSRRGSRRSASAGAPAIATCARRSDERARSRGWSSRFRRLMPQRTAAVAAIRVAEAADAWRRAGLDRKTAAFAHRPPGETYLVTMEARRDVGVVLFGRWRERA